MLQRSLTICNSVLAVVVPLLLSRHWVVTVATEFLVYAPNVTYAPLGSTVTLECVADQPSFAWTVNNQQLLHGEVSDELNERFGLEVGPTEEVVGGNNRSTLSFDASVATNDTFNRIVCQAGSTTFTLVEGPSVSITVYGLPLAPVEVKVVEDTAHQLRLIWGPPFTFPGETISYSVFIEDLVTGQKETVVGLTDTVYTHSVSEAQALSCHTFHFSVSSVNDVGPSINSSSIEAVHPSAPGALGTIQSTVVLNSTAPARSQAILRLTFQSPTSCFPVTYNISLYNELASTQSEVSVMSSDNATQRIEIQELMEDTHYTADILAYNHFQFSIDNPVQADQVLFVTSSVQSVSVFQYENETLRITCTFAEGSSSKDCEVKLTVTTTRTITITLKRVGDELEVVEHHNVVGTPSQVWAVDGDVTISGSLTQSTLSSSPLPSSTTSSSPHQSSTTVTSTRTTPNATPTIRTDTTDTPSPDFNILTVAVPSGVGGGVVLVLLLLACILCCCRCHSAKHSSGRLNTLPHHLHLPNSPNSLSSSHDYKQVPSHGTIKEMSFNPLYGDLDAPPKTFDPPLPSLPQPVNGQPFSPHATVVPSSALPPVYEEVSASKQAAKQAAKLAANPQYGAVGGANGATPNPQYGSSQGLEKPPDNTGDHMYASLKEPVAMTEKQKLSLQYAQPYEHVQSPRKPEPEGVVIVTSPQKSL